MSEIVAKRITRMLKDKGCEHEIFDHAPVYTSEQASVVRGVELRTGVKAIVLQTGSGRFLLALCPADKRVDTKAIAGMEGEKKACLASPEEVLAETDCEIGSVPPFGHRKKLKTYMDTDVMGNEWVNFNIGLQYLPEVG